MTSSGNDQFNYSNGIKISYDDLGRSSIPVIFIHGFPFDKSSWQPQVDFLKKTNRVIAYDNRGYGKSEKGEKEFSIKLFADDLISFMDSQKIGKAIVCGLSMGGYILLNAVNRYAERFLAIILCDTQCISDTDEGKVKRYNTIKLIEDGGINEFADAFVKNIFCNDSLEHKTELVDRIKKLILSTSPDVISLTLKALANREDVCLTLAGIKVPTMIICGKEDKVTPVTQSEFLYGGIPGSILHIIEGAGHLSNLEQPGIFNGYLEQFIKKIS